MEDAADLNDTVEWVTRQEEEDKIASQILGNFRLYFAPETFESKEVLICITGGMGLGKVCYLYLYIIQKKNSFESKKDKIRQIWNCKSI